MGPSGVDRGSIERLVLFGASGDLTSRLLLPAVAQLVEGGLLPAGFRIVGSSTTDWSTADFRQHIAASLAEHAAQVSTAARATTVSMLEFQAGDVTDPADVAAAVGADHDDTLVYLALPPSLVEPSIHALAAVPMTGG